jgi:hypothetical protein
MGEDEPGNFDSESFLKTLESTFHFVMLFLIRRVTDGSYFPLKDYLDRVEQEGGLNVAKSLLTGDIADPLFKALTDAERYDLTVEFYVDRPPWFRLFSVEERLLAVKRFQAGLAGKKIRIDQLRLDTNPVFALDPHTQVTAELVARLAQQDLQYGSVDLRNLRLRREYEGRLLSPDEQVRQLERELRAAYPFTLIPAHRSALDRSEQLTNECPSVAARFGAYDSEHLDAIRESLKQLRSALDFTEPRLKQLSDYLIERDREISLNRTTSEHSEPVAPDDLPVLDLSAYRPDDLPVLDLFAHRPGVLRVVDLGASAYRRDDVLGTVVPSTEALEDMLVSSALGLGARLGEYMADFAESFEEADEVWKCSYLGRCRYPVLKAFTEALTTRDMDLLLFAQQSWVALPGATYCLPVLDDGLISEVSSVFSVEEFPPAHLLEQDFPPEQTFGVSVGGLLSTVWAAVRWHRGQMDVGAIRQAETTYIDRLGENPLADDKWEPHKTRWVLSKLLTEISRARKVEAEESLRSRLGPLYKSSCPEARTSLTGVEYLLQDEVFPDPTLAITGLALAFENQLKIGVLEPFCEYLRNKGIETYPEGKDSLLKYGQCERNLTLDRILRVLRPGDTEFKAYGQTQNLRADRILRAVRRVRDIRNRAAHEGGFGYEYARNLRDEWFDPQRGVFAALLS